MEFGIEKLVRLGTGCHSEIFLLKKGEQSFALKVVEWKTMKEINNLLNEQIVLNCLQHPNVIKLFNSHKNVSFPGRQGVYYILELEYAKYGNLAQLIVNNRKSMTMANRRYCFWELTKAVEYLHSKDVVHGDLKLDNVLVFQTQQGPILKLADFGFAKILPQGDQLVKGYKGSKRGFMAPEIHACKDDKSKLYDGKAADMFALGVILFAIFMGRLPFQFALPQNKHYKLLIAENTSEFWARSAPDLARYQENQNSMIAEFKSLFVDLVKFEPTNRLKISEVLEHSWLLGIKERMLI